MSINGNNKTSFNIPLSWIVISSVFFALIAIALWSYVVVSRPASLQSVTVTPLLRIITPDSTSTDVMIPTDVTTDMPDLVQTSTFPPPPVGSLIKLGSYVQVVNTGGGLRLRYEPSLDSEVNYLALDYEIFVVENGPRQGNDMTWWFLVAQADDRRNGWAAANYLQVVR